MGEGKHLWKLEAAGSAPRQRMDTRIWVTHMVGHVLGLANVAAFALVAWHYADAGRQVPRIATLGISTAATVIALSCAIRPAQPPTRPPPGHLRTCRPDPDQRHAPWRAEIGLIKGVDQRVWPEWCHRWCGPSWVPRRRSWAVRR